MGGHSQAPQSHSVRGDFSTMSQIKRQRHCLLTCWLEFGALRVPHVRFEPKICGRFTVRHHPFKLKRTQAMKKPVIDALFLARLIDR